MEMCVLSVKLLCWSSRTEWAARAEQVRTQTASKQQGGAANGLQLSSVSKSLSPFTTQVVNHTLLAP
ncbi:hypothetical protein, partial [Streptococcus pseudopneumoniae]|uniref:hypothetical protein n=1 Tax=Streptococcus pseudopneumoniae TaxID=257758 RepID=UPI0019D674BE